MSEEVRARWRLRGIVARRRRRPCALLCFAMLAVQQPVAANERTIRCESYGFRYQYCRADTDGRVELVRRFGFFPCDQGRSWGHDPHGVWVDKGCSGEFRVGKSSGHRDRAVLGAVVGLAALAAIAASQQKHEAQEVKAWAVGSFSGRDAAEAADVSLSIRPGGQVTGRAGTHDFTGALKGDLLEAGRQRFRIVQQGNGFLATDELDASHRVLFRRSGSGY